MNNHLEISRRDFIKAALFSLGVTTLYGCNPFETSATDLPEFELGDLDNLRFPTSPFNPENVPHPDMVREFADGKFRTLTLDLKGINPLGIYNDTPTQSMKSAETATYLALDKYEKIIQIQKKVTDQNGQITWETLNVAGSTKHKADAQNLAAKASNYLKSNWTIDAPTQAIASGILHTVLYDSSLDDSKRSQLISELIQDSWQPSFADFYSKLKASNLQLDSIPEDLPLDQWADVHASLLAAAEGEDETWGPIIQGISTASHTSSCIFVPKKSPEMQSALDHALEKEFFALPPIPKIYYVVSNDPVLGIQHKIYVTNNDQSPRDYYNHNFAAQVPAKEYIAPPESWKKINTSEEARNLSEIHKVIPGVNATEVYELNDDQIGYFLIPNKGKGSPHINENEINARLVPGIKQLQNSSDSIQADNPLIILLGRQTRDIVNPKQNQDLDYSNWIVEVTESCREQAALGIKHLSKLGLLTPNEFFYRLFMTRKDTLGLNLPHNSILPQDEILRMIALDRYIDADQSHTDISGDNWAFATGKDVPIYKLSGTNFSSLLNSTGFQIFSDTLTESELLNEHGKHVHLKPGEAMSFSKMIEDDKGNKWILLSRVQRDDTGGMFSNIINSVFSDQINQAFAIRYEDALKYITPVDPDNNILEATKTIAKIAAVAGIAYSAFFAPELAPSLLILTNLTINSKFNALVSIIKSLGAKSFARLIP